MSRHRRTSPNRGTANPQKTDAEAKAILVQAMADCGATPAAVYAFHKTGVILTEDNESRFSPEELRAWNDAIEEYEALAGRPNIVV
jgi:hypothetical protein